ncbi:MAG: AraC family transcriptional regulator [Lachnospiraceae bacterium]|nr:AraC family transcriptional regulator [Lachnospiraceae bacterium]
MKFNDKVYRTDSNLKITAFSYKQGMKRLPLQFHDKYEIGFVKEGEVFFTCNGREYRLREKDMYLMNPEDKYCFRAEEGQIPAVCAVLIDPKRMKQALCEIGRAEEKFFFSTNTVYQSEQMGRLIRLYEIVGSAECGFEKEELFLDLLGHLFEHYGEQKGQTEAAPMADSIEKVCCYIKDHYSENITLEQLSQMAGFSKYYFIRVFSKEMKISPHNYLKAVRVNEAIRQIENGNSLAETAIACGFGDQSHMNCCFRQYKGISPKQYKSMHENQ